jgi:hypothetical protein
MKVWTQNNTVEEALSLPKGRYCADFGFRVEQSVEPDHVLLAAQALIDGNIQVTVASQAAIIVKAKQAGVAFENWAELSMA